MEADLDGELTGFAREMLVVAQRFTDAMASASSTATDPTGTVSVTVLADGTPTVQVDSFWTNRISPEALGATIVET